METKLKIKQRYHVKRQSISQIARELNLARNTIKRVLRTEELTRGYVRRRQPLPQLGDYVEQLKDLLTAEQNKAHKCQITARSLYNLLRERGYQGAYDSVQRYVKQWRKQQGKPTQAYIPLCFAPGEAYQFDWSQESIELAGVIQTVHVAHIRLCFSRKFLVIAYFKESQELLFDAHNQAFAFFGGNPKRGIYDNLKTGIDRILTGKQRQFNQRFLMLLLHYRIEPTACTPGAGWEKGQVENQVQMLRKQLFVPRPSFKDLAACNTWLTARCVAIAASQLHPEQRHLTLQEVFVAQEQLHLQKFSAAFDGFIERTSPVSNTCLVRFEHNYYSVDCAYASKRVSLRCYAERIVLVADDKVVGEHPRCFARYQVFYDPWHYVNLLERKPGALRNGAPFAQWQLPVAIRQVQQHLLQRHGGDREFVKLLTVIRSEGIEAITVACELALEAKAISADYILNIVWRLKPNASIEIKPPRQLQLRDEPLANCQRYDALLQETYHVIA